MEKDVEVSVDGRLTMSWQCPGGQEGQWDLGKSVASRQREVILHPRTLGYYDSSIQQRQGVTEEGPAEAQR